MQERWSLKTRRCVGGDAILRAHAAPSEAGGRALVQEGKGALAVSFEQGLVRVAQAGKDDGGGGDEVTEGGLGGTRRRSCSRREKAWRRIEGDLMVSTAPHLPPPSRSSSRGGIAKKMRGGCITQRKDTWKDGDHVANGSGFEQTERECW